MQINPEILEDDISIIGIDLQFKNKVEPNGYFYHNQEGDEAIITLNHDTGNMFGSLKTHNHKSYTIEKCKDGHIWKEFTVDSFSKEIPEMISPPKIPGLSKMADRGKLSRNCYL